MTVGIIGSGMIGGTVARLSVAAGHHVVLSNSRGPETLKDLVAELGPLATAATAQQAATAGDIVVVSVPLKAYPHLPAEALAGKVILDTGNYYPQRDGYIAELDTGALTSTRSPASAACPAVPGVASGPSSAASSARVSGPRELLTTT